MTLESLATMSENPPDQAAGGTGAGLIVGANPSGRTELELTRFLHHFPGRDLDKGQQNYEEQQRKRSIAALRRRAANLDFAITPAGRTA
jgi:hypothetical protein